METKNKILWAVGSILASVLLGSVLFAFKGDAKTVIQDAQNFGNTSAAGVTNFVGIVEADPWNTGTSVVQGGSAIGGTLGSINLQGNRIALTSGQIICALQNPSATASSSIASFTLNLSGATTSAAVLAVGTTTSATATSTSNGLFASVGDPTISSSTAQVFTFDAGPNNSIIAPGGWITVGFRNNATNQFIANSGASAVTYTGDCEATFQNI